MEYKMEELLPIVAELAQKYTSGESSSITYERAAYLMEGILYCLAEAGEEEGILPAEGQSAWQAYLAGTEKVREKLQMAKKEYERLFPGFCAYGSENYSDTVLKGLAEFFKWYDPVLAPQETILTLDYPVLKDLSAYSGIDAIWLYLQCICLEQKFMGAFEERCVREVLTGYDRHYEKQFYNICSVLLRHVLRKGLKEEELKAASKQELLQRMEELLGLLVREGFQGDQMLFSYLKLDLKDFVTALVLERETIVQME